MAAKLLHSLTDDNPDLQKQIGCMTGIFQLFDRHHILTGRRFAGDSPKRLPAGSSHSNNGIFVIESSNAYLQLSATEKQSNKSMHEKHRISTESSRASFSSSSHSSSFSSLDCNKTAQPEPSNFDHSIFSETPIREPAMSQSIESPQVGQQALDLRDVVKDSMYRDARGLSVRTMTKEDVADCMLKHRDSRPPQLSKTNDGSYNIALKGMENLPIELKESIKILAKLREAPWYFNEAKELSRSSSYGSKEEYLFSAPKDAPRFSYDGREINWLSFESREISRSTLKLKELPRLSLDSRGGSMRNSNSDSKSNFLSKCLKEVNSGENVPGPKLTPGNQTRPPGVVAKLMGLEVLPDLALASGQKLGSIKTSAVEDSGPFTRTSRENDLFRPVQTSIYSRNLWKEPTSPHWKNPDSVMKPTARFPMEPAPWRQPDGTRGSQKPATRHLKAPAKASSPFPSVYCEIEKRFKDLKFTQSGKDLRALKQILDAMQAKGLLDTQNEGQDSNFPFQKDREIKHTSPIQSTRSTHQQNTPNDNVSTATNRGCNFMRPYESPIVIMKPRKLVAKSGIPANSVISLSGISGPSKFLASELADNRKCAGNNKTTKDQSPRFNHRDTAASAAEVKTNSRNLKSTQTSARPQQSAKESPTSFAKNSGSISPRMQQKKLELEKRSRPPTPPSDLRKSRRHVNKQQPESSSPGGRQRPKASDIQQSADQLSDISGDTRNYQESDVSLQSDGDIVSDLKLDVEVISSERSAEIRGCQSMGMTPALYSASGLVQKIGTMMKSKDESSMEPASIVPDYHSPVSVLDDGVYTDDAPSPAKQMPETFKDAEGQNLSDNPCNEQLSPTCTVTANSLGSGLTPEINRKKLQSIQHLVQKLRRLNSSHDEDRTDYIASLCENSTPDHRYVSEILLASGLLLRDVGSSLTTFQFHSSGLPINPELFLVLEQTKASTLLKEDYSNEKVVQSKHYKEKCHRRLIFDAVNEILVKKLASVGPYPEPWLRPSKMARKNLNAQKLLRELCLEIEKLQSEKPKCSLEEDDGLKCILWEDVLHRSESWTDFLGETQVVVLDVERLLFKDLVDEIVLGEAAGLRVKTGRHCRKLFGK